MARRRRKANNPSFANIIIAAVLLLLLWLAVEIGIVNAIAERLVSPLRPTD